MQRTCFDRSQLPHWVVLTICAAICLGALAFSPPRPDTPHLTLFSLDLPSTCSFYYLTGWPCPGCGLTRAMVAAAHGDLAASWDFHRLGALTLFYILMQLLFRLGKLLAPAFTTRHLGSGIWLNRGLPLLAVLFVINWVINLVLLV